MILVILTALVAVCGAAKLDQSYLSPISARTAGGSAGALLAPLDGSNQGLPSGSFTNDVQGVVVDAVNPGTRTSGHEPTGLGGPRTSYGSTDSKVGGAAFIGSSLGSLGPITRIAPGFGPFVESNDAQADKTSGNTLKFSSDVGLENYSYGFETDNGISVGENGQTADGVKAQGGYSYKGDDGKTYSVSYTADKGGYKPQGQHLPTPPPIPSEILISLEKNAKEEAAGHVDDGSYDAQKYNNEGDYSSNGAGSNNGRPTIGSGVASSGGSYVSQSSHRPTSGVLVGTYNPGSVASHSSQGHSAQGFSQDSSHKQSVGSSSIGGQFGQAVSKDINSLSHVSSSQGVQSSFSSHSTENRFGVQSSKSEGNHAHAQASVADSPVRSPSFHNGASAYSSAVTTGSGSASAFASTGPLSSGLKNDNLPTLNSFGSASQHTHDSKYGSASSAGASFPAPSAATASASISGSQTPGSHANIYSPNLPSSASASASVSGNQHSYEHSNQQVPSRFKEVQQVGNFATNDEHILPVNKIESTGKPHGFDSSAAASIANVQPLSQHSSQSQFVNYQSSNQASHSFGSSPTPATSVSSTHTGAVDATYASSTQKPFISQQQGIDDSYFYKHPSKPFVTPSVSSSSQYANNYQPNFPVSSISQQGSKYPNTPTTPATGQYQGTGSPSYNGITQAAISPFTTSSTSTQFESQSSQFGSKPSAQFAQSGQQTSTQFGSTETHSGHKPIVQSQTQFGQSGQQLTSTQFGSTETHSGHKPIVQGQTQFGQSGQQLTSTQFGSTETHSGYKPIVQSQTQFGQSGQQLTSTQFSSTETHSGHKPIFQSQTQFGQSGQKLTASQLGSTETHSGHKPIVQSQPHFGQSSTSQTSDSSQSPTQQYQGTIYQYNKPATTLPAQGHKDPSSSFAQATFSQTNSQAKPDEPDVDTRFGTQQGSSKFGSQSTFQQTQKGSNAQTSQFGQKPIVSSQVTGSNYHFGSSGSQFDQKPLTTQGSIVSSNTITQNQTPFGQKPVGSSQTTTQFGSTGSQFGSKPQNTQGSSFTYSQSQTSQFGKKPVSTTQTGVTSQQTQFGSTSYQFGQHSQSTASLVATTAKPSYGQKPIGSSYQQTQFGSPGSQFVSKPQTTQGSSFTYSQGSSQNSQFGKKPDSTTQTGATSQQTQFGSSGSQFSQNSQFGSSGAQFGQNSQSIVGAGSVSTTTKPSFSQKPFGSTYQQTQFGSKPQTTQGSIFTYSQGSSQTSQFGKKPVSTTQTGATSQQTQFASSGSQSSQNSHFGSSGSQFGQNSNFGSGSQFGQNSQSIVGAGSGSTTTKPSFSQNPFGSTYQQTQFGSKPQTTQGPSFTYSQGSSQTSQFGKKPVSTTQTGATSQQTQFGSSGSQFGQNSQFGSSGAQFGQNSQSIVGTGSVSTTTKPSFSQKPFGSTYQHTQFGSKPQTTQGPSFTGSQGSSQTSQFGKKPISTTQTGATSQQTQFGSSGSQFSQNSQFGSSGAQFGQNSQSIVGAGSVSTTTKPSFSQKPSGSTYQPTQFGSNPQTTQGSSFTYSQGSSQTSLFGKKPVSTTQTGVTSQQTQFGSSGSQFGQNSQSIVGAGLVSTTTKPSFSQKPFGSTYQHTQFGSKPQSTQGSSFTYSHGSSQTSQFGKKPVSTTQTGATSQQTQFGSSGSQFGQNSHFGSSSSQFGQNSQSIVGSGSVLTTAKPSFSQKPFGSTYQQTQFGSKPQTTQGSSSTYSQATSQTSQSEKKPVSINQTGAVLQQNQFGSTGTQFGQNFQSTQGSGLAITTSKPSYGQKPLGSSYQQNQFGSSGSQFGQNSQSSQGSGSVSTTSKPAFGQTSIGSSSQQTQFGSQFGQKPQMIQGSSLTSNTYSQTQTSAFGKKPENSQTGSAYQQTQFGSSGSQFGQKPLTTTITGVTSTNGQVSFGQKPSSQAQGGSFYQQSQFGSTQGSSYASNSGSKGQVAQTSQFGVIGLSQNIGSSSQSTQHGSASGSGNKLSGSSSASGSNFQQTQFAGSSGSQFGQTTQTTQGIISQAQPVQTTQYGIKPFSSSQNTQGSTQFVSIPSRFGESSPTTVPTVTIISQTAQPTQFGQKPFQTQFGSTAGHFGQKPQAQAFASNSGSNVVPFGNTQTVSKYQQNSQFGSLNQGVVSSTQKPLGSSLSQTNYQQFQYTQTADKSGSHPQFGQASQSNLGTTGQIGQTTFGTQSQKPFGSQSTQATYQQTQFAQGQKPFSSSQGSGFQFGQSTGDQPTQGTVQTTSVAGYNYQKPQSVFTNQYGGQGNGPQDQKVQQTQSNFNSAVSTSQTPINGQPLKPFGISSTQGTFQQSQSTVSSSQFGAQPAKPTEFSGPVIQTSYNQFSGQPFQPASTASTQGSNVQSQSSAVSTSQFGLHPTQAAGLTHFSGQPLGTTSTHGSSLGSQTVVGSTPEYSVHPSHGVVLTTQKPSHISVEPYNPSVFSSAQASSVPSGVGSNEGLVVSTVQAPIVPVPGYEIVTSNHGAAHGFVGLGEEFGGPRDPPRFDDKTGYHY